MIADINSRGGIAGRKVVPVFYDYKTSDVLTSPQQGDQAACTAMTQDRPVFAVVAVTGVLTEELPACLAKYKTPLILNNNVPLPKYWFTRWAPYFYSTGSPMTERYVPIWLRRADALGYFSAWDTLAGGPGRAPLKIGILTTDSPAGRLFTKLVTDELARHGRKVADTFALANATDQNGVNAAVLRFKSEGVTHVIPDGLNLLLFPQSAENQRYRPRYAISTAQSPLLVVSAAPPAQLTGTVGVGYFPSYDVDNAHDPGDPSPAAAHCREIQKKAGQDTTQREAWNLMTKACDGFNLVTTAVGKGGLSPEGMSQGVQAIKSMPPAGTFAISFSAGRTDGMAAVRDLMFRTACKCFVFPNATNRPM